MDHTHDEDDVYVGQLIFTAEDIASRGENMFPVVTATIKGDKSFNSNHYDLLRRRN